MEIVLIGMIAGLALAVAWAYRRGFQEGYKIGNMKDKAEPAAVERVFNGVQKPQRKPAPMSDEERKASILRMNLDNYRGSGEGQRDVK